MKRKATTHRPKALRGALKQVDTLADKPTMTGGGKRMKKAREKRLEKASV